MTATSAAAPLNVGDAAPDFALPAAGGGRGQLTALRGKQVLLYFYPKDDTSACTLEAREFSALADAFADAGAIVIGVSRDNVASHERFAAKHNLAIVLASDLDGAVAAAYGVWVEKSMYGKRYMGIERATFLIDAEGRIRKIWRKVKAAGHAAAALEAAQTP